jgi:hypothetical protein
MEIYVKSVAMMVTSSKNFSPFALNICIKIVLSRQLQRCWAEDHYFRHSLFPSTGSNDATSVLMIKTEPDSKMLIFYLI